MVNAALWQERLGRQGSATDERAPRVHLGLSRLLTQSLAPPRTNALRAFA
jgi:hypothetical protein